VLLLSARAGEEARIEGMAAGADDYLVKPFGARELLARMAGHLKMVRIRREAARRESQLRAEVRLAQEDAAAILESITDGFAALDGDWRFTHINAEAERIIGIRREDHIGKNHWELFPATLGTLLESEWRRAMAERVAVDFENYYAPWDSWFHVKAYPSRDGGLSVFFHDITARKRSEEALRKSHSDLEERVRERTRELSETNARLARQILKRERIEEARTDLLRRLISAHEDEHRRIARELHDDLTQRLAILAIDCSTIEQSPACSREVAERLRGMREQVVAMSEGLHSLSRRLHPAILDNLGLVETLRSECSSLAQRHNVAVKFFTQNVPPALPRDVALCVYRVAQESLRNIVRHSQSPSASVRISAARGELVLCVRDRGVGFEVTKQGKGGLGLESMRERARLLGARLAVRSRPGEGAKIVLRVPLEKSEP
jgi:PAS domain S-box-containing protein